MATPTPARSEEETKGVAPPRSVIGAGSLPPPPPSLFTITTTHGTLEYFSPSHARAHTRCSPFGTEFVFHSHAHVLHACSRPVFTALCHSPWSIRTWTSFTP